MTDYLCVIHGLAPCDCREPPDPGEMPTPPHPGERGNLIPITDGAPLAADLLDQLYPAVDWQQAFADEQETSDWIVPGIIPAHRFVVIYSGRTGDGKTLITWEIIVAASKGHDVFGVIPVDRPYRVLVIDFENDPRHDIATRLADAGHKPDDLDNVVLLSFPSLPNLATAEGARHLAALVDRHRAELLVIDTVNRGVAGEENSADTWADFYRHSGLELKRRAITFIRLDQAGKDAGRGPRGSSNKVNDVDLEWRLDNPSTDVRTLKLGKHRMPVESGRLELRVYTSPGFHHEVDKRPDLTTEQRIVAMIADLDQLGVPNTAGRPACLAALKDAGKPTGRNADVAEAIRRRKARTVPTLWDSPLSGVPDEPPGTAPGQGT